MRAPAANRNIFSVLAENEEKTIAKKEARSAREANLGARQVSLPDKKYGVIVADPEWRFEPMRNGRPASRPRRGARRGKFQYTSQTA